MTFSIGICHGERMRWRIWICFSFCGLWRRCFYYMHVLGTSPKISNMTQHRWKSPEGTPVSTMGPFYGIFNNNFKHAWCTPYSWLQNVDPRKMCLQCIDESLSSHTGMHVACQPFLPFPTVNQPALSSPRHPWLPAYWSSRDTIVLEQLNMLVIIFIP